ncbi:sugar ABC transporter substrate-binding protein [Arthrobacter sp. TES]|uniref:sugar ABC transporter substrate-binding protein n=1 Tax=Paenarthrobacter ureafaciens TaxID=37931 RepID=UPI0009E26EC9|nr:sugar ABC transporter substrate-binding protein [Arthrobacter sp. TES]
MFNCAQRRAKLFRVAAIGSVAALLFGTSACSSPQGESGKETKIIGYSTFNLTNPYFAGILKGLEDQTEQYGWKLVVTNSNNSVEKQVSDIDNMLTQGVDVIMLTPADAQAVLPAIESAKRENVPVFALGDTVSADIDQQVLPDSVAAAEEAVDQIAAHLKSKYGEARGSVVNVRGKIGTVVERQREEGFRKALEKYPAINVVAEGDGGFDTAKANSLMADILQANAQVDAVWAANDAMAVGASAAINSAGRFSPVGSKEHIYVISMDGAKPAIEDIRKGVQDATVSQNPIEMAATAVRNVKIKDEGKTLEKQVNFPTLLITGDNIKSPEVLEYGIWADDVE